MSITHSPFKKGFTCSAVNSTHHEGRQEHLDLKTKIYSSEVFSHFEGQAK